MNQLQGLIMQTGDFAFHPVTGESYTLNSTGREIIKLICEGYELEMVVLKLMDVWKISKEEAWNDVLDFVARLRTCGLM
jgi:hypothetical protein